MSQPSPAKPASRTFLWRIYDAAAQAADRAVGWDKLPRVLGLLVLVGLRDTLRQRNLHDTSALPSAAGQGPGAAAGDARGQDTGRVIQRPGPARHGHGGHALRP